MHFQYPEAGLTAIRVLKARAIARDDAVSAVAFAERQDAWRDRAAVLRSLQRQKSGVGGLDSNSLDGAGDAELDLLAALRPLTIAGRLPLRRVPAMVPMLTGVNGATAHWVGEGRARRMSVGTYARSSLRLQTVSALTVATKELLRDPSLDGEETIRGDLLAACALALDSGFVALNGTVEPDAPASIIDGLTPIISGGDDPASIDADLAEAVAQLVAAGSDLRSAYWITSPDIGTHLGLLRGSSGAPCYPGMGALGGVLAGLPCITSAALVSDTDGGAIVLVDAGQIAYAEGVPEFRTSENASIEMDTEPTGDALTPTGASAHLVSMFQADAVALMASFHCNWASRRAGMVAVIRGFEASL